MAKIKLVVLLVLLFVQNSTIANSNALIDVKIGLLESLSPVAPTASERYKRLYEGALFYALGANEHKLQKCGYKITTSISYFDIYDAPTLINSTHKLENNNAWVIIGPRRSNHFIIASRTLKNTPMISTMANAEQIYIQKNTFTMYPKTSTLAKLMVDEVTKQHYGASYGTLVDVRCDSCVDFAKTFRQINNQSKEMFYLEVADSVPNLDKLREYLEKYPIDYLVIPNYSDLSGYVISKIQNSYPSLKYVGSDGWGEDSFSFLQGYGLNKDIRGLSIRVGSQKEDKPKYTGVNSLDREIDGTVITSPQSIYAIIEVINDLTADLCQSKAKTKEQFSQYLNKQPSTHFRKNSIYSFYSFKEGSLIFSHYVATDEKT